ncbi:hypothetical protein Mgra_00008560 [Meloidogyne graminicola]|uniref:Uncharacterized protein n=1 Tax=Meloidogyne graminicola TaxID=189291 RepID=A0A8S9ZFF5_9BILA|nr:hypothetical protein Mgra_00008560 [Meloidogyne graminicola]
MRITIVLIGVFVSLDFANAGYKDALSEFKGNVGVVNNDHSLLNVPVPVKTSGAKSNSFMGLNIPSFKSIFVTLLLTTSTMIQQTNGNLLNQPNFVLISNPKDDSHLPPYERRIAPLPDFHCDEIEEKYQCTAKLEELDPKFDYQIAREIEGDKRHLVKVGDVDMNKCDIGTAEGPNEPPKCTQVFLIIELL